jgi:hypothetical protein
MFKAILSYSNFKAAYLEIVEQFAADHRNFRYHGLDNIFLRDFDLKSQKIIKQARADLLERKEIEPALSVLIPKPNKPEEFREIFIYNLKERIKAQAIYRVVLPEFEKNFSDRLLSYRPGRPPYLAARIFCRHYRKEFRGDQALVIDAKNYSDRIDREMMSAQLEKIFPDKKVLGLLRLFVFNQVYRQGVSETPAKGLVQGVPLIALFANLYLADLDFKYQVQADFYIRVGDDIALLDHDPVKLSAIKEALLRDLQARGLEINEKKLFLGAAEEPFSFLGYAFQAGTIGLESGFVKKVVDGWKNILTYQHKTLREKKRLLAKIMNRVDSNFNYQFQKIIKTKCQINDTAQVKKMSEKFFAILTRFMYEHYSPRQRRLLEDVLSEFKITSLYKTYNNFHYDRR